MRGFELSVYGVIIAMLVFVCLMLGYVTSQINYNNDVTTQTQAEMLLLLRSTDHLLNLTGREQIASHNEIIKTLEKHIDDVEKQLSLEHGRLLNTTAFNQKVSTTNQKLLNSTLFAEKLVLNKATNNSRPLLGNSSRR